MSSPDIEIKIHEFSTGIHFQERANGWVSLGFTGQYMNATINPIPTVVERSIANQEFALTEGSSTEKLAIIGRVVGSGDDIWSVMAVVTRGQDEVGRSAAFYRYFLCKGINNLRFILTWWEQNQKPTFNPLNFKGSPHLFMGESGQPHRTKEDESLPFEQDQAIVLPAENQRDLYTLNALAIIKFNKSKKVLPVAWAFNVEALEKPERFQVIQPASPRAYDGLKRAIASAAQVVSAINVDEAALKSAIRSLMNSSTIKPEAVQEIVKGLENEEIESDYWESLFNAQGADKAIKQKIYSPQMVRLITLRAMVIPETLPEFLEWLNIQAGKKPDENQTVSLDFQKAIRALFPKEQIAEGIRYLLLNLLNKKISVDSLCWLLATNGSGSVWAYVQKEFITDVKYDLQLICNYFAGQSNKRGLVEGSFKCQKQVWAGLMNNWGGIQQGYYKGEEYEPFAELFEKFRQYDLAAYFYQVSDRVVKKDLFHEVANQQGRRRSSIVFGLPLQREVTLVDIVLDFITQEYIVPIQFVVPISIILFLLGFLVSDLKNNLTGKKEGIPSVHSSSRGSKETRVTPTKSKTTTSPSINDENKLNAVNNFDTTKRSIKQIVNEISKTTINGRKPEKNEIQFALLKVLYKTVTQRDLSIINLDLDADEIKNPTKERWVTLIDLYQKRENLSDTPGIINDDDSGTTNTYYKFKEDIINEIKNPS